MVAGLAGVAVVIMVAEVAAMLVELQVEVAEGGPTGKYPARYSKCRSYLAD